MEDVIQKHTVSIKVTGFYSISVYARNREDAIEKAQELFSEANFGELAAIDGSVED